VGSGLERRFPGEEPPPAIRVSEAPASAEDFGELREEDLRDATPVREATPEKETEDVPFVHNDVGQGKSRWSFFCSILTSGLLRIIRFLKRIGSDQATSDV
jgi:hypothetical protein